MVNGALEQEEKLQLEEEVEENKNMIEEEKLRRS